MTRTTKPDKRQVRASMDQRIYPQYEDPPPTPEDICRELGWDLIPHNNHTEDQP